MIGTVVITGASSGIGEACARSFAALKAPLVLGARRLDRLEQVAKECRDLGSPDVLALPLDVRDAQSITAFAAAAEAKVPEILVNNAGLARGRDAVVSFKDEDLVEMVETNIIGFMRVARALIPGLAARQKGHIVNMGSLAAHGVYEGGSIYCATKSAVRAISQTLRLELSGTNVRLTEIAPGLVETEFSVVRNSGDEGKAKSVYSGIEPLVAQDIADCVIWACTRPGHVNIGEIVLTPTAQASLTKVHRKQA